MLSSTASIAVLVLLLQNLPAYAQERLRMATTTSVQDSGLMAYLLPHFESACHCKVDVIAVGTGQALQPAFCSVGVRIVRP